MKNTVLVLLAIVLLSACSGNAASNKDSSGSIAVKTKQVTQTDAIRIHEIPSVILAKQRADISFLLSGTVEKVVVKLGENVEKGQVLMSLYNPKLDPNVASNLAKLESVKAQIYQIKRDVVRFRALRKNNSTSKNAFEQKETELKDFKAKQSAIKAQIDLAIANQQESFIRAPFSGIIVAVNKQVGEFVQAGQVVLVLNQAKILEVELALTKHIHDSLWLNQVVNGHYENQKIQLIITELAQVADNTSHLRKVVLEVEQELEQAIGQEIIVHFPQVYKNVYQLPLESVVDDGINKPYVFIAKDKQAQKHYIKPLFIDKGLIVFSSPIEINYPVVIKGQSKLSSGMELK